MIFTSAFHTKPNRHNMSLLSEIEQAFYSRMSNTCVMSVSDDHTTIELNMNHRGHKCGATINSVLCDDENKEVKVEALVYLRNINGIDIATPYTIVMKCCSNSINRMANLVVSKINENTDTYNNDICPNKVITCVYKGGFTSYSNTHVKVSSKI